MMKSTLWMLAIGASFGAFAETTVVNVNAAVGKTNVDYVVRSGDVAVGVNDAAKAGTVRLNSGNVHTGGTTLNGGVLDVRQSADATQASDVGLGSLTLKGGIFKYSGPSGATWTAPITNAAANGSAVVWQTDSDIVVDGDVGSSSGAFIKTGAGTLTLKSHIVLSGGTAVSDAIRKSTVKTDLSPYGAPTNGYSNATFLEGTTIIDSPEGDVASAAVTNMLSTVDKLYTQIGGWTTDDGEEKSAIVEHRGGVTLTSGYLHIGMNNGKAGQTGAQPYSGLRVTGGRFLVGLTGNRSVYMGYSTAGTQKNHCFLDISSNNRFICDGFYPCYSKGSVCDVYVHDGGYLYDLGGNYTTGGNSSSAASTNNLTVTGAGSWISLENFVNDSKNGGLTTNIRLEDGAVMEMRNFQNSAKGKLNLVVDGGIWRHRNNDSTLPHWPKSMTSVKVGPGGLIVYHNGGNVLFPVTWDKGIEPLDDSGTDGGVHFTQGGNAPQLIIRAANTYCGPTEIQKIRVELGGAGRLPETTALFIKSDNGGLLISNGVQRVKSLWLGYEQSTTANSPLLGFSKGSRLDVTDDVTLQINATPKFWLFENEGVTNTPNNLLTSPGIYTFITAPLAAKEALSKIASALSFPLKPDTVDYTAYVVESGNKAELRVEVTSAGESPTEILSVATTAGNTNTVTSAQIGTAKEIRTNPAASGGGTVVLGDSLVAYDGVLKTGCGRTEISDLSFVNATTDLVLGPGTLAYTGASASIPGFAIMSYPASAVLDIPNEETTLSVTDFLELRGALSKMGAGTLHFGGTGTITLTQNVHDNNSYNGVAANGDGPRSGFRAFNVNGGAVTIGTVDDPTDAPTVVESYDFSVGSQSHRDDGRAIQTAGELVLNNGSLSVDSGTFYISYYCGSDPDYTLPLYPRFTQNGGIFSCRAMRLYQDAQSLSRACPQFFLHGGTNTVADALWIGYQACPADFDGRVTYVVDGGLQRVGADFIAGYKNGTLGVDIVITGGCVEVSNEFFPNNANATETNTFLLAHGGILACAEDFNGNNKPSICRFDGGIYQPLDMDVLGNGHIVSLPTAYLGKGGLTFDLSRENSISHYFVVQQAFTRDPDLAADETDGGIRFTGNGSAVLWKTFENSSFDGGILVENGARLVIATNCVPADSQITVKPGAYVSDGVFGTEPCTLGSLTLGEEGATELTYLEVVGRGLIVNGTLSILSPVAIATRAANQDLVVDCVPGVYTALVYAASNADVDLTKFVLPPEFPNRSLAVKQITLGSGEKAVVATIGSDWSKTGGTMWIGATGGTWSDTTKWQSGTVPPSGATTKVVFTNATKAAAAVSLDAPVTVGALQLNSDKAANGYTLSGEALTLGATGTHAEINNVKGTHEIAASTTVAGAGKIRSANGATISISGGLNGVGDVTLNTNVRSTEGKVVAHVDPAYTGKVTTGGGTVEMDDLSFVKSADQLTLGLGTLKYTGEDMTIAGMRLSAGDVAASVFENAADVTVNSLTVSGTSAFLKRGTGKLRVHGKATLTPNTNVSNASGNKMGSNGDCPVKGLRGLGIAGGAIVWGELDDPDNAPVFSSKKEVTIGAVTSTGDAAFILNNGKVTETANFYLGYYGASGYTYTFQMNGGIFNGASMACAYNWVNGQDMNTVVEINGGRGYLSGNVTLARNYSTKPTLRYCKWTQNGGVFGVKGTFYGSYWDTNQSPRVTIDLNGGLLAITNSFVFNRKGKNTENNDVSLNLNAGGRLEVNAITQQVASVTSKFYGNGGTLAPNGATAAGAVFGAVGHLYASTNGLVVDTSILAGKSMDYTIGLPIEHDPDAPATDGGVVKQGAGLLTLSGANTFTGPLTLAGGTVALLNEATTVPALNFIGGALAANATAGTLIGAGLCNGSLAVTSVLKPAVGVVVNVTGDLTINKGVKVDLTAYPEGSFDVGAVIPLAVANGTANIPAKLSITPDSVSRSKSGSKFHLMTSVGSDGLVTGTVTVSGLMLLVQ